MRGLLVMVSLALVWGAGPVAAQTCLHGANETEKEQKRRRDGVALLRRIHTAEAMQVQRTKRFVPLNDLKVDLDDAKGWAVKLITDGTAYAVIIKDTTDPCGFAYTSADDGLIYSGHVYGAKVQ